MAGPVLALEGGEPLRRTPYPAWPALGEGDFERVREVLSSSNWGGSHRLVTEFEKVFAVCHDARFGIAVSSGTMALELAMHASGIGRGDEVVVPAHSFVATATAVSRAGATPVFADIERDTFNIDPDAVAECISGRTRALVPVHFGGVLADMDRLAGLAEEHGFSVIEDAAHAHGAERRGSRAGGCGRAGAFSFQNSKAMTAGEGGILVTSDEGLEAKARSITNAGRVEGRGWFEHFELGTNLRMTAFQAALLFAQLGRLDAQIRLRATNFAAFRECLGDIEGFTLQQAPASITVQTRYIVPGYIDQKRFGCDRDRFVEAVQAEGVPVRPFYPHPLYKNPLYERLPYRALPCPVAEQATRDSFWLPMHLFMGTEEDAADAARAIRKVHEACPGAAPSRANGSPSL